MATQLRRNSECSEAEWTARQELAACYRIFDMMGWSESIYNHITVRVPGEEAFLINPYGLLWSEVTASNLVKIDSEGNKLCSSPYPVNKAGFTQHACFHHHIEWAHAIVHTHTPDTMAVCSSEDGLTPTNFYACFFEGQVGYHDFEGITVRAIAQLDGTTGFAEIFFDDVFVPDADVLGAPGDGWRVAMSTAGNERGLSLRAPGRFMAAAERLVDLHDAHDRPEEDAAVVDAWIGAEAYRLFTWQTVSTLLEGGSVGAEGSINKVFWSELDVHIHETALRILGPEAELRGASAEAGGRWVDDYQFSLAGPIYAGTNEVQRNIIAERILSLPRGGDGRRA